MTGEEQTPYPLPTPDVDPIPFPDFADEDVLFQLRDFAVMQFGDQKTDRDFINEMKHAFPMPAAYLKSKRSPDKLAVGIITQEEGYISCTGATVISWYWLEHTYPEIQRYVLVHRLPRYTHAVTLGVEHPDTKSNQNQINQIGEQLDLYKNYRPVDPALGIHMFDLTENGGFGVPVREELPSSAVFSQAPIDAFTLHPGAEWNVFTTLEGFIRYHRVDTSLRLREKKRD